MKEGAEEKKTPCKQRVTVTQINGRTVYSAGFWPGWGDITAAVVGLLLFGGILGFLLFVLYKINIIVDQAFEFNTWIGHAVSFVFGAAFDLSLIALLAFLFLWMPYFLIYVLSPKQFWIENDAFVHTAYLLGIIPLKRIITFERVLDVEAEPANGRYMIKVIYERKLPKWLFIILVHWNERLTQWILTLVNGIESKEEAERHPECLTRPYDRITPLPGAG